MQDELRGLELRTSELRGRLRDAHPRLLEAIEAETATSQLAAAVEKAAAEGERHAQLAAAAERARAERQLLEAERDENAAFAASCALEEARLQADEASFAAESGRGDARRALQRVGAEVLAAHGDLLAVEDELRLEAEMGSNRAEEAARARAEGHRQQARLVDSLNLLLRAYSAQAQEMLAKMQ